MSNELLYALLAFELGYLTGRADSIYRMVREHYSPAPKTGFFAEKAPATRARCSSESGPGNTKISIDERKFVSDINTTGIVKSVDAAPALGETQQIQDDINSSVNKLAQLKGR